MGQALGLRFEGDGVELAYEATRASLGLNEKMTAAEFLVVLDSY